MEHMEICTLTAPQPLLLFVAWGVSIIVSVITLPLGIVRLRKVKPVERLIAINRVVGVAVGIICLCSLIGQVNMLLLMRGTTTPNAAQAEMAAFRLSHVLNLLSVSVFVCGMNGVIAVALNQKWREPQPTSSGEDHNRTSPEK